MLHGTIDLACRSDDALMDEYEYSYTRHVASLPMKFMVINELACCYTIFVRSKYIYSIGHIYIYIVLRFRVAEKIATYIYVATAT